MGLFDRWRKTQQPGMVLAGPMMPTAAGNYVSEDQAMRLAAVQACVRVLSEDVAALPLHIYRRTANGGKERAIDHPLYELLHDRPNSEMTSMDFRQSLMVNVLLSGNAYAFIEYDKAGRVLSLWPIVSTSVEKLRDSDGRVMYRIDGRAYTAGEILPVHGLSYDGQVGMSPIAYARAAIGLAGAAEEFGSRFFGQGTHMGGVVSMPGKLSDETYERLRTQFRESFQGLKKSHGVPILEEGATYTKLGVDPGDAQFLETRKFQRSEIAAIYRVPPHMIGDLEHATFSNIEHQSIEYLQRTLTPWLVRIEQAMRTALLTREERKEYLIEHDTANFLRGDTQSRMQAYATAVQAGIMTPNECRVRDNLAPVEGGDVLLRPLNMQPAGKQDDPEEGSGRSFWPAASFRFGAERRGSDRDINAAMADIGVTVEQYEGLREAFSSWLKNQAADVIRLAERILGERDAAAKERLLEAINGYYADLASSPVPEQLRREIGSISEAAFEKVRGKVGDIEGLDENWIKGYMDTYCDKAGMRQAHVNQRAIEKIVNKGGDVLENLRTRLEKWPERRAASLAETEAAFAASEAFVAAARKAGYSSVWRSSPGCCKACTELNDQVLHGNFRPPLHAGCSCTVDIGERFKEGGLTEDKHETILINGDEYPFHMDEKKQQEHILGTKAWKNRVKTDIAAGKKPPAFFDKDVDVWEVVRKYSGTGIIAEDREKGTIIEYVTVDRTVGRTFEKRIGTYTRTDRIAIRYSKRKGIHTHPTNSLGD